ncbi:MAG: cell division FtsA domain-containing protein [Desulfomicrobium escambiense]|nr:cell division FtsA domain-containing protein [Desulfomicrobium escambiense]
MIDIGGGTTDVAIFERGCLWHTADRPHRRRPLHQRHRRRPADADPRGREAQADAAAARLPVHGRATTRRWTWPASAAGASPASMARRILAEVHPAARRGDLPPRRGTRSTRVGYEKSLNSGHRADRRRRHPRRAWPRSPSRSSTCPCGAGARRASAGWPTTSATRRSRRPWGCCCARTGFAPTR